LNRGHGKGPLLEDDTGTSWIHGDGPFRLGARAQHIEGLGDLCQTYDEQKAANKGD
jgi:hypothetical protein